jgi:hypothetical protein
VPFLGFKVWWGRGAASSSLVRVLGFLCLFGPDCLNGGLLGLFGGAFLHDLLYIACDVFRLV